MARVSNDRIALLFWRLGAIQTHAEQHLGSIVCGHYQASKKEPRTVLEKCERLSLFAGFVDNALDMCRQN